MSEENKKRRIAWLDSCAMPTLIHALPEEGAERTICGHVVAERGRPVKVPLRKRGRSNVCRLCFNGTSHNIPWALGCAETEADSKRLSSRRIING